MSENGAATPAKIHLLKMERRERETRELNPKTKLPTGCIVSRSRYHSYSFPVQKAVIFVVSSMGVYALHKPYMQNSFVDASSSVPYVRDTGL